MRIGTTAIPPPSPRATSRNPWHFSQYLRDPRCNEWSMTLARRGLTETNPSVPRSEDFTLQEAILIVPKLRAKMQAAVLTALKSSDFKKQASGYSHTYFTKDDIDFGLLSQYPTDLELSAAYEIAAEENNCLWSLLGIMIHPMDIANAPDPGQSLIAQPVTRSQLPWKRKRRRRQHHNQHQQQQQRDEPPSNKASGDGEDEEEYGGERDVNDEGQYGGVGESEHRWRRGTKAAYEGRR
ncbi:hypothetical protein C8R46DRAFT_1027905 [Mycena filopes]|nr:hypothetical protein C8R46DRAFT_1027905 [Mycena filopes]